MRQMAIVFGSCINGVCAFALSVDDIMKKSWWAYGGARGIKWRYGKHGIAVRKAASGGFWLQAKSLSLVSKRLCGYKQKGVRL